LTTFLKSAEDGRFNFHVEIDHPLTGMIVRYRGWLVPRLRGQGWAVRPDVLQCNQRAADAKYGYRLRGR